MICVTIHKPTMLKQTNVHNNAPGESIYTYTQVCRQLYTLLPKILSVRFIPFDHLNHTR